MTPPAAPPGRTLRPLSMRPLLPRAHTTTLPVAVPAASVFSHRTVSPGRLEARTTGVGVEMPFVSVTPGTSSDAPPSAVRCSVELNERGPDDAPTVVTHGPPWSEDPAPGPLLPAEALTEIPAFVAS